MAKETKIAFTFEEWMVIKLLADRRMKAKNGHQFVYMLKTRCEHCGRSPKTKNRCGGWFQTFLSELDTIFLNLDRERADGSI